MLEAIRLTAHFLAYWFAFTMLVGLYQPWIVLWWASFQNRKKVILLYGSLSAFCYLLYWLIDSYA